MMHFTARPVFAGEWCDKKDMRCLTRGSGGGVQAVVQAVVQAAKQVQVA